MSKARTTSLLLFFVFILVTACAPKKQFLHLEPGQGVELENTPFFPQQAHQCGPASLAMILGASGVEVQPDVLVPLTYIPARQGSLQLELIAASRKFHRIPYEIDPELSALLDELRAGHPVLVLQNYGLDSLPAYHYAVVIGVQSNTIILRSGKNRRIEMEIPKFLMSWKRTGSWGLIVLNPHELPASNDIERYLKAVAAFEVSGHTEQAEKAYQGALSRWPEHQTVMFALGNNYMAQNKVAMAEAKYRKLLVLNQNHVAAANNLAESLYQRGCKKEALAVIDQATEKAKKLGSPLENMILQTRREISSAHESTNLQNGHVNVHINKKISKIPCPKI